MEAYKTNGMNESEDPAACTTGCGLKLNFPDNSCKGKSSINSFQPALIINQHTHTYVWRRCTEKNNKNIFNIIIVIKHNFSPVFLVNNFVNKKINVNIREKVKHFPQDIETRNHKTSNT